MPRKEPEPRRIKREEKSVDPIRHNLVNASLDEAVDKLNRRPSRPGLSQPFEKAWAEKQPPTPKQDSDKPKQ